ncbi:MAG: radical SAM protein [Alphaproteobacteria bacterium]
MTSDRLHEYLVKRISPDETYEDLLRFPRYFQIETVNACNARCPMCTVSDWARGTPSMKEPLFRKIADELIANAGTIRRVSLHQDGEPLLDKALPDRVAYLKDGGIRDVGISTNVSLLDEANARRLLEARLDTIILSIDSLDKAVFESIRVRLNHDVVMANALRFIALRDSLRPATRIWVRMVRQPKNYEEWPEFERFWHTKLRETDRVNYHNVHNWGGQLGNYQSVAHTFEPLLPCVALWSLMVIFADGRVPLCNADYNNHYPTGSVADHSIAEVWNSAIMTERRRLHLTGAKGAVPICKDCTIWEEPPDGTRLAEEYAAMLQAQATE